MSPNPLFETWTTPFGLPPFDRIRAEHFPPAFDVAGTQGAQFGGAALVIVPKLHAGTVKERYEKIVNGGCPREAAPGQFEFFNHDRVEQAGEIRARRHAHPGEGFFHGAGSAHARAAFDDQDALTGTRKVGGAGEAVMAGADDDRVPGMRGQFADRRRKTDFAKH